MMKSGKEINDVFVEIAKTYSGYEFEKTPIELVNYHEKCPV